MQKPSIGRVDFEVDRSRKIVFPPSVRGDVFKPEDELLRPAQYTLDHLGLWYAEGQQGKYLNGWEVFASVSQKPTESFLSWNDGFQFTKSPSLFIERFGREKQYVLWGSTVFNNDKGFVPLVYALQKIDKVFFLWEDLKSVFFGKDRPALRFTTPGT